MIEVKVGFESDIQSCELVLCSIIIGLIIERVTGLENKSLDMVLDKYTHQTVAEVAAMAI